MLDEQIERFRRQMEAPWDHLRERRVLREVERSLDARQARRAFARRASVVAVAAVLIVAAPAFAYFAGRDFARKRGPEKLVASTSLVPSTLSAASAFVNTSAPGQTAAGFGVSESRGLADGTRLDLSADARVDVKSDTRKSIQIAQNAGFVRYNVPRLPGRAFVVMAQGVQVQVKGTVFVVGVEAGKVSVKVERGLVHVAAASGDVELGVGDELSTSGDEATPPNGVDAEASPPANGLPSIRAARAGAGSFLSADALLGRADTERRSGDLAAAATTLRSVVARYPNDARAPLAWFTLGKVERALDHSSASALAFRTSFSLAPEGPLSEDALAEQAAAWAAAGDPAAARTAAGQYLQRFPNGTHAVRMQRIVE